MFDLGPPPKPSDLWLPPQRPAIIRPIEQKLLRPGFLPLSRHERRAALKDLVQKKVITPEQAKRAFIGFFVPAVGTGDAPAVSTFIDVHVETGDATSYSIPSLDFGAAADDRYIVVAVGSNGSTDIIGTIGGVTTVFPAKQANGTNFAAIGIAHVPTGLDGTITFDSNGTGTFSRIGFGWYRVTGLLSATARDSFGSTDNPGTGTLLIPSGGVAFSSSYSAASAPTHTWSGLGEDFDEDMVELSRVVTGASGMFAAEQDELTVTCTRSASTAAAMAGASWR